LKLNKFLFLVKEMDIKKRNITTEDAKDMYVVNKTLVFQFPKVLQKLKRRTIIIWVLSFLLILTIVVLVYKFHQTSF